MITQSSQQKKQQFKFLDILGLLIIGLAIFLLFRYHDVKSKEETGSHLNLHALAPTSQDLPAGRPSRAPSAKPIRKGKQGGPWMWFAMMLDGKKYRLLPSDVDAFLNAYGRTARNLVAAWRITGDDRYLRGAALTFPNDPQVALCMSTICDSADRLNWLQTAEKADPSNGVPHYLAMAASFEAGDHPNALTELQSAVNCPNFTDYSLQTRQVLQEIYENTLFEGTSMSETQAQVLAGSTDYESNLFNDNYLDVLNYTRSLSYADPSNTPNYVLPLLQLANNLNNSGGATSIRNQQTASLLIQNALGMLDPQTSYSFLSDTPQNLIQEQAAIQQSNTSLYGESKSYSWLSVATDADVQEYLQQFQQGGQPAAYAWVKAFKIQKGLE